MPVALAILTVGVAAVPDFSNGVNDGSKGVATLVRWRRVGGLVSAWVVTVPIAGGLAALLVWTLGTNG